MKETKHRTQKSFEALTVAGDTLVAWVKLGVHSDSDVFGVVDVFCRLWIYATSYTFETHEHDFDPEVYTNQGKHSPDILVDYSSHHQL